MLAAFRLQRPFVPAMVIFPFKRRFLTEQASECLCWFLNKGGESVSGGHKALQAFAFFTMAVLAMGLVNCTSVGVK